MTIKIGNPLRETAIWKGIETERPREKERDGEMHRERVRGGGRGGVREREGEREIVIGMENGQSSGENDRKNCRRAGALKSNNFGRGLSAEGRELPGTGALSISGRIILIKENARESRCIRARVESPRTLYAHVIRPPEFRWFSFFFFFAHGICRSPPKSVEPTPNNARNP